jgi:hypothetical protein
MVYFDKLSVTEKRAVQDLIKQQSYLERTADIEYQCYFEKINQSEFWAKYLWGNKNINREELIKFFNIPIDHISCKK